MTALLVSMGGVQALPVDLLLSSIPSLPRHVLDRLVERAIETMDEQDGDPDVELNGDELDATGSHEEDTPYFGFGPGDGYPGDPDDAEDGHDQEKEECHA